MSYSTRRYAMDQGRSDRDARELERVATIRRDLEARGLGPTTTATRVTDHRTLVLDAQGWVHAVVWSAYDGQLRMYYPVSLDLRGDPWAPGSRPWEPRVSISAA